MQISKFQSNAFGGVASENLTTGRSIRLREREYLGDFLDWIWTGQRFALIFSNLDFADNNTR
jgi:hypothetical protein